MNFYNNNDKIDRYIVGLSHVLRIAKKEGAMVTDIANIGDIMNEDERAELNIFMRRFVQYSEYVWEVAEEIEALIL